MHLRHIAAILTLGSILWLPLGVHAHDLTDGSIVRIQSTQTSAGWHEGKVQVTRESCALIWFPDATMPGGKMGLGLMFLQKLERKEGAKWIDVPVAPMMEKEPKQCQEGAG